MKTVLLLILIAVAVVSAGLVMACRPADQSASGPTSAVSTAPSTLLDQPAADVTPGGIQGPLRVSAENPRYFTDDSGRAVYLCGSHTWLNLQDGVLTDPPPEFDYDRWLDFIESYNHNFFRLWTWEQSQWLVDWKDPLYFSPSRYQRTGPGYALDGKPKFDLTKFNEAYFQRLRDRVVAAGDRGMHVSVMLFNGWSVSKQKGSYALANPWEAHPFNAANNINAVNGDPDGDGSGDEIQRLSTRQPGAVPLYTAYEEAFVRKVVDTLNDLDNVLYEIANETNGGVLETNWQYHMIDLIHEYEASKPKQHPVGMTVAWPGGDNSDVLQSPAEWVSPNSPDGGGLDYPPIADGTKVVISDTDHLVGIGGDRMWVWKAFTQGENPLFMDRYEDQLAQDGYTPDNPNDVSLRLNLGFTRSYAERMNLLAMEPHGELSSSGYALANPVSEGAEYLVYLPAGGEVTVDLSGASSSLEIEWFDPSTGTVQAGGQTAAGAPRSFASPFDEDSVLYLRSASLAAGPSSTSVPGQGDRR